MSIDTKFSLGDKVYTIVQEHNSTSERCYVCEETGSITFKGEEYYCPKCHGNGVIVVDRLSDPFIEGPFVITGVSAKRISKKQLKIFPIRKQDEYFLNEGRTAYYDTCLFSTKKRH